MNKITYGLLLVAGVGTLIIMFWGGGTQEPVNAPGKTTRENKGSEIRIKNHRDANVIESNKHVTQKDEQLLTGASGKASEQSEQTVGKDLIKQFEDLSITELVRKLGEDLSEVERNALEQLLARSLDQSLDELLEEMLDDGMMDLGLTGDEFEEREGAGYLEMATERLNSAIRVTGLKENIAMDSKIIAIATSEGAEESTVRASYEALGYLGTPKSTQFLNEALTTQTNPFLKSEIVLSLSTSGSMSQSNVDQLLRYVSSQDVDLRNSAIVALGEAKEVRAVSAFAKVYSTVDRSSKVLMVQALRKIGSGEATELLDKIGQSDPNLVTENDANN